MTTYKRIIDVRLEDDYTGEPCVIPVELTYLVERDNDYGADADGRRGGRREEVYILDQAIDNRYLMRMSVGQIEYVLDRAITTVGGLR